MTPEERHLWYDFLKLLPITVNRQKAIGNYIVDFYIHSAKLVIEIDGAQHDEKNIRNTTKNGIGGWKRLVLKFCVIKTKGLMTAFRMFARIY